jgi:tRNA-dihydrouridine synthase A
VDGVMIGRAAYDDPFELAAVDRTLFDDPRPEVSPEELVRETLPYIEEHLRAGGRLGEVTRHMLPWFSGRSGARKWRRTLSEGASRPGAGPELVLQALGHLERFG